MKKRVGAFLLAFTLTLTSIVSYAEEEIFTETVTDLAFTEEMLETEPKPAEDINVEETLPEEDIQINEPEEDAETWKETAAPEEEAQGETSLEEVPVMGETEKQEIEEDSESETEPWDGFFTNDHPEKGGILIADISGAGGRKLTFEIPENVFTEKVTLEIRDEIITQGALESGLLGSDDVSVLQKVLTKDGEVIGDTLDLAPIDAGKYKVVASISETSNYAGTTSDLSFTIEPIGIAGATVELSKDSYVYDGVAKAPEVTVKMPDGTVLVFGTDYDVNYSNNIKAGEATVTITGIGNYAETVSKSFEIEPISIAGATVELSKDSYVYDGVAKAPEVTVKMPDGTVLVFGTDYDVNYSNNIKAGEATVTITGIGNYTGTVNAAFTITEPESETAGGSGAGSRGTDSNDGSDKNASDEMEAQSEETSDETESETEASTEEETDDQETESVKTGDTTPVMPVIVLFFAAGVYFLFLLRQRREREER